MSKKIKYLLEFIGFIFSIFFIYRFIVLVLLGAIFTIGMGSISNALSIYHVTLYVSSISIVVSLFLLIKLLKSKFKLKWFIILFIFFGVYYASLTSFFSYQNRLSADKEKNRMELVERSCEKINRSNYYYYNCDSSGIDGIGGLVVPDEFDTLFLNDESDTDRYKQKEPQLPTETIIMKSIIADYPTDGRKFHKGQRVTIQALNMSPKEITHVWFGDQELKPYLVTYNYIMVDMPSDIESGIYKLYLENGLGKSNNFDVTIL